MKILGIDPGFARTGYGLIQDKPLKFLSCGIINLQEKNINKRFFQLGEQYKKLLADTKPDIVAIEKVYFARNAKTAIDVAQARGILVFLTLQNKIPLAEYTPIQVKQATTNYGLADKKAVAKMVVKILKIDPIKKFDDISDALAIAITARAYNRSISGRDTN
jgi:crossover junction endodeoxyribonuclease RuvC